MNDSARPTTPSDSNPQRHLLSSRFKFGATVPDLTASSKQQSRLEEFRKLLASGRYRLVHEPCPCGTNGEEVVLSEVDRYGLPLQSVLCRTCGTVRIDPYLDAESLENFYRELYQELYGRALEPTAYFERQRAYGRKIRASMFGNEPARDRSVLEVGCGAGGGLLEFAQAGFRVAGCDMSDRVIAEGTSRGVPNLHVGSTTELLRACPEQRFDLIFLHHVYEHVGDPVPLLQELRSALHPQGRILIVVPELYGIDRHPNPAGDALTFFHIAHKYNYSYRGLSSVARHAELAATRVVPPRKMPTAWSLSPELWAELRLRSADEREHVAVNGSEPTGDELLRYLLRTERLYQWGLAPAQLYQSLRSCSPDRVVRRVVRRLRA